MLGLPRARYWPTAHQLVLLSVSTAASPMIAGTIAAVGSAWLWGAGTSSAGARLAIVDTPGPAPITEEEAHVSGDLLGKRQRSA